MRGLFVMFLLFTSLYSAKVELEVLGSGGPELDGRASTSYILWIDDDAKLLVDMEVVLCSVLSKVVQN